MTRQFPLYVLLTTQVAVQVLGVISLVSYLSYRSGQRAVGEVAQGLVAEVSLRLYDYLQPRLTAQQQAVTQIRTAVESGELNLDNPDQIQDYLWKQLQFSSYLNDLCFRDEQKEERCYRRIDSISIRDRANQLLYQPLEIGDITVTRLAPSPTDQRLN